MVRSTRFVPSTVVAVPILILLLLVLKLISSLLSYSTGRLACSTILDELDGSPRRLLWFTRIARSSRDVNWKENYEKGKKMSKSPSRMKTTHVLQAKCDKISVFQF